MFIKFWALRPRGTVKFGVSH